MKRSTKEEIQKNCTKWYDLSRAMCLYHGTTSALFGIDTVSVYLQHLVCAKDDETFNKVVVLLRVFQETVMKDNHFLTFIIENVLMEIDGPLMSEDYEREEDDTSGDWIGNSYPEDIAS